MPFDVSYRLREVSEKLNKYNCNRYVLPSISILSPVLSFVKTLG